MASARGASAALVLRQAERRGFGYLFQRYTSLHIASLDPGLLAGLGPGLPACLASVPQKWATVLGMEVDAQQSATPVSRVSP